MNSEVEVRIYNWIYIVGTVPPLLLIAVFGPYLFDQMGIYWMASFVATILGLFLLGVALKGLFHIGPILIIAERGLKICHPFCNLGWVEWKDILRIEVEDRTLLIDFSKHFLDGNSSWRRRLRSRGMIRVPLGLMKGMSEDRLIEVLQNHYSSERF